MKKESELAKQVQEREAEGYCNRGMARLKSGDLRGAAEDYEKALQINPRCAAAYNNRGALRHCSGDLKGSMEDLDKALEINPRYSEAYYNRGAVRAKSSDPERAIEDYGRALEINPRYSEALIGRALAHEAFAGKELEGKRIHLQRARADLEMALEVSQTGTHRPLAESILVRVREALGSLESTE